MTLLFTGGITIENNDICAIYINAFIPLYYNMICTKGAASIQAQQFQT